MMSGSLPPPPKKTLNRVDKQKLNPKIYHVIKLLHVPPLKKSLKQINITELIFKSNL